MDATTLPGTVPASTTANPYGLTPGQQAWMQGLQGLGSALNSPGGGGGANFMRPNPGNVYSPGGQSSLLATLMAMRQQQAQALGSPFQPGIYPQMPRVSLLG